MAYPGGKGGDGVYQTLINLMPPHETYIESFVGGGAVMRHKRPARVNIGVDRDAALIHRWQTDLAGIQAVRSTPHTPDDAIFQFIHGDAIAFLRTYPYTGHELVYNDPPYVLGSRACKKYRHEMTDDQHRALLDIIKTLPCKVMITGYWTALYAEALQGWATCTFMAQTRKGPRENWVWMNYPRPTVLHDDRYVGDDFRQREQIKRKKARLVARFSTLSALERQVYLSAITETCPNDQSAAVLQHTVHSEPTLHTWGGKRRGKDFQADNVSLNHGNSKAYLMARLKRDFPAIFAALLRGEYQSVRQAAQAAGIAKARSAIAGSQR